MGKGGGNKSKWKARSSTHHCGGTRLERSETYLFRESLVATKTAWVKGVQKLPIRLTFAADCRLNRLRSG